MSTTTENLTTSSYRLKAADLQWLIENYDQRRMSIATRATMVVIANSIVFAALAQVIVNSRTDQGLSHIVSSSFGICVLFAALASVIMSIQCTVNLRSQAKMFGKAQRGIFHPRTSREKYGDLEGFKTHFSQSEDELLDNMKEHLWILMCEYGYRYQKLRLASWSLIAAFGLLVVTFAAEMLLLK